MGKLILSLIMLLVAGIAWADVEINEKNFPDENFRKWILGQSYGKEVFRNCDRLKYIRLDPENPFLLSMRKRNLFRQENKEM